MRNKDNPIADLISEDDEDCLAVFVEDYADDCVTNITEAFGQLFACYCNSLAFDYRKRRWLKKYDKQLEQMRVDIFRKVFGDDAELPDELGYDEQCIK